MLIVLEAMGVFVRTEISTKLYESLPEVLGSIGAFYASFEYREWLGEGVGRFSRGKVCMSLYVHFSVPSPKGIGKGRLE